ncbi:hypothetical protein V1264_022022 [Littorina saxatilis]|uniref:Myb/SANT-like DNA-binding domain-containing protein n=1 Tax=Littorina saxatilis TaxID=31220 RepID=A0AAN9AJE6_9CAEN
MAAVRLGFMFEDNSFFNCDVNKANWEKLKSYTEGNYYLQSLVGRLASQYQLDVTTWHVRQVSQGGFHSDLNLDLGVLYKEKEGEQSTIARPPSPQCPTPLGPANSSPTQMGEEYELDSETSGETETWPYAAVLLLLETYRKKRNLFQRPTLKKAEVWKKIAAAMTEKGWSFSGTVCAKKWDNLRNRFKIISDRNKATGRGRTNWIFMEPMRDILDGDPSVTPPVTISSMSGTREIPAALPRRAVDMSERSSPPPSQPPTSSAVQYHQGVPRHVPNVRPSPSPRVSRKRKAEEPPLWAKEMDDRHSKTMERIAAAAEERNKLLAQLLQNRSAPL